MITLKVDLCVYLAYSDDYEIFVKYDASDAVDFTEWGGMDFNAASVFSGMHEIRCVLAEYFDYSWRLKILNSERRSNSH